MEKEIEHKGSVPDIYDRYLEVERETINQILKEKADRERDYEN